MKRYHWNFYTTAQSLKFLSPPRSSSSSSTLGKRRKLKDGLQANIKREKREKATTPQKATAFFPLGKSEIFYNKVIFLTLLDGVARSQKSRGFKSHTKCLCENAL